MIGYLNSIKRVAALALAVVITLTCVPLFGPDFAYALDDEYEEREVTVQTLSKEEQKAEKDKAEAKALAEIGVDDFVAEGDNEGDDLIAPQAPTDQIVSPSVFADLSESSALIGSASSEGKAGLKLQDVDIPDNEHYSLTIDFYTDGSAVVNASVNLEGWSFSRLCIDSYDNTIEDLDIEGKTSVINEEFDFKQFDIGYHTFVLRFKYNGEEVDGIYYWPYRERPIYNETPSIQYADFTTGKNYIKYYNRGNYYSEDSSIGVTVEYKKGSGSWKKGPGPVGAYYTKKKTGLKAASTYSVRARYSTKATYAFDDKTYTFYGPVSKTLKIKTAYKKPKVKKIKISKVKTICHKYRYYTGYIRQRWLVNKRTGQRIRLLSSKRIYRTVRNYYTKYKVTVLFRKKQGVAGIQLKTSPGATVWLGGDKKKYSKSFTVSGKKKGKRLKISIKSRRSKKYDSWSGTYKKKTRIKKR